MDSHTHCLPDSKINETDFVPLTYGFGFAEEGSMEGLDCAAVAREPEDVYRFIRAQFEGE